MGKSIRFALEIQRPPETAFQGSLFSARGTPKAEAALPDELRDAVEGLLRDVGLPWIHFESYLAFLLEEHPLDPDAVRWLNDPTNTQRWNSTIAAFQFERFSAAKRVRQRLSALMVYAQAVRGWPASAIEGLRRHRRRGGALDLTLFPQLPEQLNQYRAALFTVATEARNRFYAAAAIPVRRTVTGSVHTVEVFRCLRLHFNHRACEIRVERLVGHDWMDTGPLPSLTKPLFVNEWCEFFASRLFPSLRTALAASKAGPGLLEMAQAWVVKVLERLAYLPGVG
jgi:hypothetical protein